jgi:hypothetical protein
MTTDELFEQARIEVLESNSPYVLVLTVPTFSSTKTVEMIKNQFMEWKKNSNITIPCLVLYEGMTLSLLEKPE